MIISTLKVTFIRSLSIPAKLYYYFQDSYSHINVHLEKHANFTLLFWILTQILDILSKAVGRKRKGPAILFFIREKGTPNKADGEVGKKTIARSEEMFLP